MTDFDNIHTSDLVLNILQQVEIGTSNSGNPCVKDIDETVKMVEDVYKTEIHDLKLDLEGTRKQQLYFEAESAERGKEIERLRKALEGLKQMTESSAIRIAINNALSCVEKEEILP